PGMFRRKRGTPKVKANDLTAFIDEGSEIEGKFTFNGTVMLNGRFRGEIVTNSSLIIGEKGVVNASIRAGVVLISGEVVGNVLASERVELRGSARVFGDVEAPVVVVDEGVLFEGHCRMTKARPVEAATPATPARRETEDLGTRRRAQRERALGGERRAVEQAHTLEQRGHAHLLEDREAVVGAAAVGAEPDPDARPQQLGQTRDSVAQEHVGGGAIGERRAARAHERDLLVVEPP